MNTTVAGTNARMSDIVSEFEIDLQLAPSRKDVVEGSSWTSSR
jgi:hypothetical protein